MMGSDESHLNVSVGSDGQSHKTASINHNLFEEKGEPKRYQTEVLLLTNLMPYRKAKLAHNSQQKNNSCYVPKYCKSLLLSLVMSLTVCISTCSLVAKPKIVSLSVVHKIQSWQTFNEV